MVNYCKFIRFRFNLFMENWQYNPWEELTQTERKNKKCANDRLFSLHILKIYRSFFSVSGWTMIRVSINRVYFYHWIKWSSRYIASSQSPAFQFGQVIRNYQFIFYILKTMWFALILGMKRFENLWKHKQNKRKTYKIYVLPLYAETLFPISKSLHYVKSLRPEIKNKNQIFYKLVPEVRFCIDLIRY